MHCPNCNKELRWVPKGRHICLCGEVIETDGEDLRDVEVAMINPPPERTRSKEADILLGLSVIFVIVLLVGRILYHEAIRRVEADLLKLVLGIDPANHHQAITPFVAAAALILWGGFKAVSKIRANK